MICSQTPITTRICWCRVCQYFAAGNGSLNAVFPRDSLTIANQRLAYLANEALNDLRQGDIRGAKVLTISS